VDDAATRDLMAAYYKRLMAGEGRAEALRQVQLQMLGTGSSIQSEPRGAEQAEGGRQAAKKTASRSHPYFWASFIQSGEWANIDGKR
jgi:CHAT domain-containing protein